MAKKKERTPKLCEMCRKELIEGEDIKNSDVPNEGCSFIEYKRHTYPVCKQRYCSFKCLLEDINISLKIYPSIRDFIAKGE